jgi:NADH-quinone oxidoreductase subunit N
VNYLALLPPLLMALFGCATLVVDVLTPKSQRRLFLAWFNGTGQVLVAWSLFRQWQQLSATAGASLIALQGAVTIDGLTLFTNTLVLSAMVGLLLISYRYLEITREHHGEYYALALFAQCGMYFMASAVELVTLFVGLELTAMAFYILVGFTRYDRRSNEASLKYLLLGALSSGFVLYGFSLLYDLSGSTSMAEIEGAVRRSNVHDPFVLIASVTITIGLLFKVSAAPFHTWAPDAYEGAPTPITGYLSVASKIASFAVLMRIVYGPLANAASVWQPLLTAAAVISLTIGSIAAITQERLKRLLAYSGIAHAGYVLLGFVAGSPLGYQGIYMYLLVYAIMNGGVFAVLTSLRSHGISGENVADLRGLSKKHPLHAALFAVLLLSLAGIPPTAGFIGKYFIFAALIQTGHISLAVVASAYVVVSLYFYFRLVREMYLAPSEHERPIVASFGVRVALVAASALTLFIGLFPQPALDSALALVGRAR